MQITTKYMIKPSRKLLSPYLYVDIHNEVYELVCMPPSSIYSSKYIEIFIFYMKFYNRKFIFNHETILFFIVYKTHMKCLYVFNFYFC